MPSDDALPTLVLLDSPHLRQGNRRHDLPPSAPAALLAVLGAHGDWVARERITTLFWPDASEADAQHHLRVTLHRARQLARGWGLDAQLLADRRRLRLDLRCDVPDFRQAIGAADWARAVALHRAPLLSAFSLRGFAALDEWITLEREALLAAWRSAALRQAARLEAAADAAGAAALLQIQLQHDLLAEDSLQALLRVAPAAGARDAALEAFERFRRRAREELGLDPLPGTVALAEALRRAEPLPPSAPRARDGDAGVPEAVAHPPLVGRADELAWLHAPGQGLRVLSGEPGVGKSRLVADALPGAWWIRCREGLRGAPLQALVDGLKLLPLPRLSALLPLAADRRELARLLPALAPDEVLAPAETGATRLLDVLAGVLSALAEAQPVVIDDLQWADASLLELLQRVLTRPALRLWATMRPPTADAGLQRWLDGLDVLGALQLRPLDPLPAGAVDELMVRLSGQQAPRFAAWLHRRSGGNPFFAIETLRALFESGQLAPGERGWRSDLDALSADYAELQVPPRVAALVRQRIAGLSEAAQRVLSVVAVAGDAESLDAVAELAGLSAWATAEAVAEGQAAGLLQERRFAHDLVHEALMAGTPEPLRAVLHAGLARRLAAVWPPHRLAEHWWAAGDPAAAVQATLQASRLDADRGLLDAAEERLQRAHARAGDPALQARLSVLRAAVARQAGQAAQAQAQAQAALAELPDPQTRCEALLELFEQRVYAGDLDAAARWLDQARSEAQDPQMPALLMAAGKLAHAGGDYAAAEQPLAQLVAHWRRQRPGAELAVALTSLATTLDSQGEPMRALPLHEEAMAIAHRLGARYVEVEAASNWVWSLDELNRLDEAIAVGEQAMALGDYDATPYLLNNLAYVYLRVQRLDDAERAYQRLSQGSDASIACVACGKLADVAAQRGNRAAVQAAVQAALDWLPRTQIYTVQVSAIIAALRHGDDEQVQAALRHRRAQAVDPGQQQRLDDALRARGLA